VRTAKNLFEFHKSDSWLLELVHISGHFSSSLSLKTHNASEADSASIIR
jgi:hypothetical protein